MVPVVTPRRRARLRWGGSFSPVGTWPFKMAWARSSAIDWYLGLLPSPRLAVEMSCSKDMGRHFLGNYFI